MVFHEPQTASLDELSHFMNWFVVRWIHKLVGHKAQPGGGLRRYFIASPSLPELHCQGKGGDLIHKSVHAHP